MTIGCVSFDVVTIPSGACSDWSSIANRGFRLCCRRWASGMEIHDIYSNTCRYRAKRFRFGFWESSLLNRRTVQGLPARVISLFACSGFGLVGGCETSDLAQGQGHKFATLLHRFTTNCRHSSFCFGKVFMRSRCNRERWSRFFGRDRASLTQGFTRPCFSHQPRRRGPSVFNSF